MKLVLDTNVVLDWLVFEMPVLEPLRAALSRGKLLIVTDGLAIDELSEVLSRRQLKLSEESRQKILSRYREQTSVQDPDVAGWEQRELPDRFPRCRDPDDDCFLELAYRARAALLVSRDKEVLALAAREKELGFRIVNPEGLVALLASDTRPAEPQQ